MNGHEIHEKVLSIISSREVQIKITVGYHYILTGLGEI